MVQLDFSAFKPTTLLSKWWRIVAQHFTLLQDAHNALDDRLTDESAAREADKRELLNRLGEETAQREQADSELEERLMSEISDEARLRAGADDALTEQIRAAKAEFLNRINAEASARSSGDARLDGEISLLKAASHTHANSEVLGDITAENVYRWNRSADEKIENEEFLNYLDGVCADISRKIGELYALGGACVYDGGLYGEMYEGASLDGGDDDDDTERTVVDFGGFDDAIPTSSTIDGGVYA